MTLERKHSHGNKKEIKEIVQYSNFWDTIDEILTVESKGDMANPICST